MTPARRNRGGSIHLPARGEYAILKNITGEGFAHWRRPGLFWE